MNDDIKITPGQWSGLMQKAIMRVSPRERTGELKLVSALLAQAICEDIIGANNTRTEPFRGSFFNTNFRAYCNLIGCDATQIKAMAIKSFDFVALSGRVKKSERLSA